MTEKTRKSLITPLQKNVKHARLSIFSSNFVAIMDKKQDVIISKDIANTLTEAIEKVPHDRLFVLTDTTTLQLCWPVVCGLPVFNQAQMITIGATDECKTLESLTHVWTRLQQGGATRHSLLVNIGGGMITDLGGFAASTFKRGLAYINVPTTLLSMVDASVGGKTGINFGGLKNEIGVFNCSESVILDGTFLRTLSHDNILSGYAEMLKHGLISNAQHWNELLAFDLDNPDFDALTQMVGTSVAVKERIVEEDPHEHGIRKALNVGHTVGHAFEALALEQNRTVLHGYAVAWGMACELFLSVTKCGFPTDTMRCAVQYIRRHYENFAITCNDYPRLFEFMTHDKKNTAGQINFTLLGNIGDIRLNQTATREEIYEMLDFFREGL